MGNSIGLANAKRIEPASDAAPKPIAANTGDDSAFDQGFDEYSRAAEPLSAPHQEQLHSIVSSEFACCCKCRIAPIDEALLRVMLPVEAVRVATG